MRNFYYSYTNFFAMKDGCFVEISAVAFVCSVKAATRKERYDYGRRKKFDICFNGSRLMIRAI